MRAALCLKLLICSAILSLPLHAESAASLPAPTGYIDDYATVLSAPAKADFEALCVELHDKTKAQIFVVTVNTLDGASVDQFANILFHRWKIGEKKTDRGVLLFFSVKDHKWRIEVGYGLESVLNDAKVGEIGRTMVPNLHAGRWDDGVRTGLQSVTQVIADDAKVQLVGLHGTPVATTAPRPLAAPEESPTNLRVWLGPALFLAAWLAIFGLIVAYVRRHPGSGSGSSSGFSGTDSSSGSSDSFSGGDGGDSGGGGVSGDF